VRETGERREVSGLFFSSHPAGCASSLARWGVIEQAVHRTIRTSRSTKALPDGRHLLPIPYHPVVPALLPLNTALLRPGLHLIVGLSGGADSVALLCLLAERNLEKGRELGLILHAAHLHHGLRGEEADGDLEFARSLAQRLDIPFHWARVDTAAEAKAHSESIEEAARRLRYQWFRKLLSESSSETLVATAHTLDDQAETVLAKFLRGAWTEGLSGIHPHLEFAEGKILRPFLATTRAEIERWLLERHQPWREDSTNRHLTFTRNRIRHELLPQLESWNTRLREHLANMSELARDEESAWQAELARLIPQLILPGRPVRGGGRASSSGLSIDVTRFTELPSAVQRRLLRHATEQCGVSIDFPATEALRQLALSGRAGQKLELASGLRVERTHRELRFSVQPTGSSLANSTKVVSEIPVPVPGEVEASVFGLRMRIEAGGPGFDQADAHGSARLRPWKPGDRVRLRYSSTPKKVKEVLERMKVIGSDRAFWPVLEFGGRIIWMRGVELEQEAALRVIVEPLPFAQSDPERTPLDGFAK
jgi:tRNA(Ile)-lysidine synthase